MGTALSAKTKVVEWTEVFGEAALDTINTRHGFKDCLRARVAPAGGLSGNEAAGDALTG